MTGMYYCEMLLNLQINIKIVFANLTLIGHPEPTSLSFCGWMEEIAPGSSIMYASSVQQFLQLDDESLVFSKKLYHLLKKCRFRFLARASSSELGTLCFKSFDKSGGGVASERVCPG